jgi:hypothetical protein
MYNKTNELLPLHNVQYKKKPYWLSNTRRNFGWFRTFIKPRPYYDSSHWNYFRKSSMKVVFDEGTESTDIATNEKILLLDEYSKLKLF